MKAYSTTNKLELKNFQQRLLRKLFPCSCALCEQDSDELICTPCLAKIPRPKGACRQCGEQFYDHACGHSAQPLGRCGRCISQAPPFDQTIAAYTYTGGAAKLIQTFKYQQNLMLCPSLAKAMISQLLQNTSTLPDALVPIPLHPSRLKQRGFNQAYELAKQIGKNLNLPVYRKALIRRRATASQSGLSHNARARNMRGAFTLYKPQRFAFFKSGIPKLEGRHVMLVDDVITTGATMREASNTLRRLKPAQISVLAAAKTQRN